MTTWIYLYGFKRCLIYVEKEPETGNSAFQRVSASKEFLLDLNNVAVMDLILVPDPTWMPKSKADIPDWQMQHENLAMENIE